MAQAATVSYPDGSTANHESKWGMVKFHFDSQDINTVSLTSDLIYGELNRITINSTGTEKAWGVKIEDDIGLTLFQKTDCNSVMIPYGYAITQKDNIDSNCNYRNVTVFSTLTCTVSDVNYDNEIQTISIAASGVTPDAGTYTISYGGQTTSAIAYGATTSVIDPCIEALSTIGTGNVVAVAGTAFGYGNDIVITGGGTLAGVDMSAFTINAASLVDTGNNETQTIAQAATVAKGHWHITFDGTTTGAIAWDAAKSGIDTALDAAFGTAKIVSTAAGGIAANNIVLTFSGTGVAKTDANLITLDYSALLTSEDVPVEITASETLKGKADVIPVATVTETKKGASNLNPIDVVVYYQKYKKD